MKLLLNIILSLFFLLSGCVVQTGTIHKSDKEGYVRYKNRVLNFSVLRPIDWEGRISMGGGYTCKTKEAINAGLEFRSDDMKYRLGEKYNPSYTTENYLDYQLALITPEDIGPKLRIRVDTTLLSGRKAYEIEYSYIPTDLGYRLYVNEIFTIQGQYLYAIFYYGDENSMKKYKQVYTIAKSSFNILK